MKLPGTYYAYTLGMAVFGQTIAGVRLTALVANALTLVFIFLLGRSLFGVTAGLVACASYGVMSASPAVLGLAAHANHFVVLFALPATWWLWKTRDSGGHRDWLFSGLLFGLAFIMTQQGIFFCLFGWLFWIGQAVVNKNIFSAEFVNRSLIFGLGMFLPFGIVCLTYAIAGDFARFWFWTVTYARWYATSVPLSEGMEFLEQHLRQTLGISAGFWLLALSGLPLACLHKSSRAPAIFTAGFWIFSFLGTAAGLYFRPHYFILVLPAFALLVGMGVAQCQRIIQFRRRENVLKSLPLIFFALVLSWTVVCQARVFFQLSPRRVCEVIYPENPFVESVNVADYIREHSAPDARIAVAGSEPEIYFYAHRHSATGYIYTYALMEPQPAALTMQQEMIQEIEANKPEFLVAVSYGVSWLIHPSSNRMILDWLQQYAGRYYELVGIVRRNSAGGIEADWGNVATNQDVFNGEYITVYERKPERLNR